MSSCLFRLALFVACVLSIRCTAAPGTEAETNTASRDTCASCAANAQPEDVDTGRLNVDFLEAVKRHILSRLQMRERPNITHPVPKAAMVTALRKLHAGKVREDGRVEIPNLDGHPMSNEVLEESSEIISFAEKGTKSTSDSSWFRIFLKNKADKTASATLEQRRFHFTYMKKHICVSLNDHWWKHLRILMRKGNYSNQKTLRISIKPR